MKNIKMRKYEENVCNEEGKGKNGAIVKIWWVVKEGIKEARQEKSKKKRKKQKSKTDDHLVM